MATVRIGYRRLYDSMGCSIVNTQPINLVFPFGDHLQVEIYMGNKPKFGITVVTGHDDYLILIPGAHTSFGHFAYHADATQSSYPRTFFTEIICSQVEEISDELFAAFCREDQTANKELLSRAETHAEDFYMIMNLLSGVIGLRFHPQFIIKLLNENFIAFENDKRTFNHASSPVQVLEGIQLNQAGVNNFKQLFPDIGKADTKVAQKSGRILEWLVRAWAERDIISKFNALFIPIEMILEGVSGTLPKDLSTHIQVLEDFIETHSGEGKEQLIHALNEVTNKIRPSLIDRFNTFAEQSKMPGWETDIQAFKKFNRIRNGLLHRGDPNVRIHVTVGEEETLALEDLTERYVNYYLFQDTAVYQSHFLPRPQQSTQ